MREKEKDGQPLEPGVLWARKNFINLCVPFSPRGWSRSPDLKILIFTGNLMTRIQFWMG
jgi:hypothetical protein